MLVAIRPLALKNKNLFKELNAESIMMKSKQRKYLGYGILILAIIGI
ncbi:MAG: hypothetical protein ACTSYF_08245 [Promethearchaeota archaeon]